MQVSIHIPGDGPPDPKLRGDLRTLAQFIRLYCQNRHAGVEKSELRLKDPYLPDLRVGKIELCPPCAKLLAHAFVKRVHCPFSPKPACKHCQSHCYQPIYREQIREVMRYSGRKIVLSGRLDLLFKLLF